MDYVLDFRVLDLNFIAIYEDILLKLTYFIH